MPCPNELPTLNEVKDRIELRIAIGDLTALVSENTPDPLGYIATVGGEIHDQLTGGQNA